MTLPAATFTPVAPPPDGLAVAFTAARRRRNSKAAVSAFTGAVAIASVLSFLAPPGQSLVQEPAQPAHGLLPGLPDAPRHGVPTPLVRTPASGTSVADALATSTQPLRPVGSGQVRTATSPLHHTCDRTRIACVVVRVPAPGGPTLRASVKSSRKNGGCASTISRMAG